MTRNKDRGLSFKQKQELWMRWRQGQSLSEIGRALGKHAGSISGMLAIHGGISPPHRRRSSRALTLEDRENISRGLAAGSSLRQIAITINRPPSTVSREVARHGGRATYRASTADKRAWENAKRPKPCRLATNSQLRLLISEKLSLDWSPEQVAGWLKRRFPNNQAMHMSHETIYRSLFIQARGVLKKKLVKHLRSKRKIRRARHTSTDEQPRSSIPDLISIRERPAEVEDRAVPGHWEGDLISGSKNSHIATLVERHSRFTLLVKVKGKDTDSVVSALGDKIQKLPDELCKTLTWDRGAELADHKKFTITTGVAVYFCDPHSPWQRGSNENTNRLLRQYFPKGTDLSGHSQEHLDQVALQLNQRPRKTLDYLSPAEKLETAVALTR